MTWFGWICQRCGNGFKAQGIRTDCGPCAAAGAAVLGRPLPAGGMGGE